MRRKAFLPAGTIFMALVIALGGLGVAYGLWSDLLEINGTVATGNVDAAMTLGDDIDESAGEADELGYVNDGVNKSLEGLEEKGVGVCSASLIAQVLAEPVTGGGILDDATEDKVEIKVTNAYPGYECWVEIDVKNIGTIPIKIDAPEVVNHTNPDATDSDVVVSTEACWADGLQLHPGDDTAVESDTLATAYPECRVHIKVNQSAAENATYTFVGYFTADQWNEYTPGPGVITFQ